MIIQSADEPVDIDYDELATLKQLAREGALTREIKISSVSLAEELDISTQTASRRLKTLWEAGFIYRQPVNDGQYLFIRREGREVLWNEYEEYRDIFHAGQDIELTGAVVDGLGEGKHYISLPGYLEQFEEKLGYEPYAGTLNLDLDAESTRTRSRLADLQPVRIHGWDDDERSYGPVYCYPAKVETGTRVYKPAHVIVPERTHHDEDQLELLADVRLRTELNVESGDDVTVHVNRD